MFRRDLDAAGYAGVERDASAASPDSDA